MYPVSYEADYAAEGRNRLTTFFRYFVAIPWQIVAGLCGIRRHASRCSSPGSRWSSPAATRRGSTTSTPGSCGCRRGPTAFNYLLTDEYPPFDGEEDPGYPIRIGVPPPLDKYSRMKAFFRYIIGIPVMLLAFVQALILVRLHARSPGSRSCSPASIPRGCSTRCAPRAPT